MSKNVYFSDGTLTEQRLYEDLIIESLKIYGHDVYYLPREIVNKDNLFKEDILSKFDENYMIEVYLQNYEGFEGDGTLLSKFGVRITDEATFVISKRRWEDIVSSSNNLITNKRPNEGDVIYYPLTGQLFQIKFVEHNKPFRQLSEIQTYNLICELMEYSDERFDTGIPDIDDINKVEGYNIEITLVDGIRGITVVNGGSGYGLGTKITFAEMVGISETATATPIISNGTITSVTVTNSGDGYITEPSVIVTGTGSGAVLSALLASKGNFEIGEDVIGIQSGAVGKLVSWDARNKKIEIIDVVGNFLRNETIRGVLSDAQWVIGDLSTLEIENDEHAENDWFEQEGDKIVEFNILNPFGEYAHMDEDYTTPVEEVIPVSQLPVPPQEYDLVPSTSSTPTSLGNIEIDTSNLGPGSDNYIMIYDADTNKYIFVSPQSIGINNDANPNPTIDDFGSY